MIIKLKVFLCVQTCTCFFVVVVVPYSLYQILWPVD